MDKLELSISQSKSHVFWRKDYIPPNEGQSLITQTLRFEQNRVRVTLHPTYMYLQEPVVNDFLPCYIEDKKIQEAGVYIMQSKINPESKYFKIKEAYENFELQIAELGIKHDCIEECSICCSDLFYVSENEALYLLAQVLKMGNIRNLAEVYHKAKRQAAFLKENDDYVHKLVFCNWTSQSKEFYNFGESYTTQEPCPFLDAHGKCIGYSARPNICRLYGTRFACRISGSKDRTDRTNFITKWNFSRSRCSLCETV